MPLIIIVTLIAFVILIVWTWRNLGDTDKYKKIIFIVIGLIVSYIITLIIFNLSKDGIEYKNYESEKIVQNMLVAIFTSINSLILVPYYAKIHKELEEKDIKKYQFQRKILILAIIILVCAFVECGYLKDTQKGILKVYELRVEERY